MNHPLVSIIVPVYNTEKYLSRCIQSVLAQTYTNWELLLIDDGSTDSSGAICDKYAAEDNRIRVFHKENGGVSSARNLGLDNAQGEWISFADADDFMKSNMCECLVQIACTSNSDMVICGVEENDGGIWAPVENVTYDQNNIKKNFKRLLVSEVLSPTWNKLFEKKKIHFVFDESVSFGEDLLFSICYISNSRTITLTNAVLYFHEKRNDTSLVSNFDVCRLRYIEIVWGKILEMPLGQLGGKIKYYNDLTLCVRSLLNNKEISWFQKKAVLNEWHLSSLLKNSKIVYDGISTLTYIQLFLLKYRLWIMLDIIICIYRLCR